MFSSRNIHFAILGIILGATSGYILAFYQVPKPVAPSASASQSSQPPQGVDTEQLLALFQQALAKNPSNPELLTRYGLFLAEIGRRPEAEKVLKQLEGIDPKYAGVDSLKQRLASERGRTAP